MLEAEIDLELRRRFMGHTPLRAEYGEEGSLAFRAKQLGKIAYSFDAEVVSSLPIMSYA